MVCRNYNAGGLGLRLTPVKGSVIGVADEGQTIFPPTDPEDDEEDDDFQE